MVTALLVSLLATVLLSLAGFLGSSGLAFCFLLALAYGASLLGVGCVTSVFFTTPKVGRLVTCTVTPRVGRQARHTQGRQVYTQGRQVYT